ncbi:MAG TPA: DUF1810 family protein [Vicinamibacterales bacterium]|nr:DUF1810 family protein [Vicinamibacterales bacterium]
MASHLQRFKDAQDQAVAGFESALSEMRSGAKRSHWIWYVFPQLSGLGQSAAALTYGLRDISEAREYLCDSLLRARLLLIASAVAEQIGPERKTSLPRLMGSTIDVTKLVSSMTLFGSLAKQLHAEEGGDEYAAIARVADEILSVAKTAGYSPCQFTLDQLQ